MPEVFTDYRWARLASLKGPEMREVRRALRDLRRTSQDQPVQDWLRAVWGYTAMDEDFALATEIREHHCAEARLFAALAALPDLPPWVDAQGLAEARTAHAQADSLTRLATGREFHRATIAARYFSELARTHLGQPAWSLSVEVANALYGTTLDPESVKKLKKTAP
mgnify:FL=1